MPSKCVTYSMFGSILIAIAGIIVLVVEIIATEPPTQTREEIITSPIQTRAIFDSSPTANGTSLLLNKANEDIWLNTGASVNFSKSTYELNLTIPVYEQVKAPKYEETGGYRLQQNGEMMTTFDGSYELQLVGGDAAYSTLAFGPGNSTRNTVKVTPKQSLTQTTPSGAVQTNVTTVNYDAMSTWFKLKNAPYYKKAWQIMAVVIDKMNTQSFQTFYYAFYSYWDHYYEEALVLTNLQESYNETSQSGGPGFDAATAQLVYNDTVFGMSSFKALSKWQACAIHIMQTTNGFTPADYSDSCIDITNYFAALTPPLAVSATQVNIICGKNSQMEIVINKLEARLILDKMVPFTTAHEGSISSSVQLSAAQWATTNLLGTYMDTILGVNAGSVAPPGYQTVGTMFDLDMNFMEAPEFTPNGTFSAEEALWLLSTEQSGTQYSLANPTAIYNGFVNGARREPVMASSSTTDGPFGPEGMPRDKGWKLLQFMWKQNKAMDFLAEGQLIAKTINATQKKLTEVLPAELAARNLGHYNNYVASTRVECSAWINAVTSATAQWKLDMCDATTKPYFDIENLAVLRTATDGMWYRCNTVAEPNCITPQQQKMMNETGMDKTELDEFYAIGTEGSFGANLQQVLVDTAAKYSCRGMSPSYPTENMAGITENCTSAELAPLQWGSAYMSSANPVYNITTNPDKYYIPNSLTIWNWGVDKANNPWPNLAGVNVPLEFTAYTSQPYYSNSWYWARQMDKQQVGQFSDNGYSNFGFGNIYNNAQLWNYYRDEVIKGKQPNSKSYWRKVIKFYGIGTYQLARTCRAMQWMVTMYTLEGLTKTYDTKTLVMGYDSEITEKVNQMEPNDISKGILAVDAMTTPIMNNWKGPTAGRIYTLFTGEGTGVAGDAEYFIDEIGDIRQVDADIDQAYALLKQTYWDGNAWQPSYWVNEDSKYVPRFYSPWSSSSNYNIKFQMQNTVDMSSNSWIRTFNTGSFTAQMLQQRNSTTYCSTQNSTSISIASDKCIQDVSSNTFEKYEWDSGARMQDTYNMPYNLDLSDVDQTVDRNTGYTTRLVQQVELSIAKGNHFFAGGAGQNPVVAKLSTRVEANLDQFYNLLYPRNGTYEWATSTKIIEFCAGRRADVDSTILICVATVSAAICIAIAVAFSTCYFTQRASEKKQQQILESGGEYEIDFKENEKDEDEIDEIGQPILTVN